MLFRKGKKIIRGIAGIHQNIHRTLTMELVKKSAGRRQFWGVPFARPG
jgi:hypothetical protein